MGDALPLPRPHVALSPRRRVLDVRTTPDSPTMYAYLWEDGKRVARALWRLNDEQLARFVAAAQAEVDRRRHLNTARRALGVETRQRSDRQAGMGE